MITLIIPTCPKAATGRCECRSKIPAQLVRIGFHGTWPVGIEGVIDETTWRKILCPLT
jgi:hypothetical protein